MPYITQALPAKVLTLALSECLPEELPDALDKKLLFENFLIPWILFNWLPFEDFGIDQFDPDVRHLITHCRRSSILMEN